MIEYSARITSQDTPRVGGRNLFRKEYLRSNYTSLAYSIPLEAINPREGDNTYILSFDYKISPEDKASSPRITCLYKDRKSIFWDSNVVRDGEWHHKEYTIQLDTDERRYPINGWFADYGSANGRTIDMVAVRNIKLERGTIATDWTPAPEDLDNRISNVSTSLTSLASTLLDPNEGDIPQLFRQQDQLANSVKDKADKLELANSVSSLQGEIDKRALGLHLDNAFAYIENIVKEIDSSRSYTISDSGYISSSVHNSCRNVSKEVTPSSMACRIPNTQPQIRLTLRSDHDALKRQVDFLTAQLTQLQATTKIAPVLNTDTRKRSGSTTLYPRYGDWLLTSDSADQYISFSGLRAEIGRSIYIQTRRKAYLSANGHSFYGLPGSSTSVNQWLSNNTTYRFVRASATAWLVTSSSSPYPWT